MKKYLIYIGVVLCLALAGHKIYTTYRAYSDHTPLAAVGECLEIQDQELGRLEVKIVKNDNRAGISEAVVAIDVMPGAKIYAGVKVKYSELRDLGAKKTECTQ